MSELIFTDKLLSGLQYAFQPTLFNQLSYLYKLTPGSLKSFFIVNEQNRSILGQIHFHIQETKAISLSQALFGSIECAASLPGDVVRDFILYIEDQLQYEGIDEVAIIHPPKIYSNKLNELIIKTYKDHSYSIGTSYKNHHFTIENESLGNKMHYMEKRKLQKSSGKGLQFYREPSEHLDEIFEFITVNRKEKSIPVSISLNKLKQSFELFPEKYFLFTIKDHNVICAATVAVQVTNQILYNFLPASSPAYNSLSPSVMLYEGLYSYCHQNGNQYLDLGISTLSDGTDQEGLIKFKENMGGIPTIKYKFLKTFSANISC